MLPAPGQGALAVQCRADDSETLELLRAINHDDATRATSAERYFLQALGGGCSAPIAAYARNGSDGNIELRGLIASPSGGTVIRVSGTGSDPETLAGRLASQALEDGAAAILDNLPA
jgi:hydroxymethylbilane synthase